MYCYVALRKFEQYAFDNLKQTDPD
jgi:hypothetical protein